MTGCAGAMPDADHGWLAKVLAGVFLACVVLNLARSLPADERDAFAQHCERMLACAPKADVEAALRQRR